MSTWVHAFHAPCRATGGTVYSVAHSLVRLPLGGWRARTDPHPSRWGGLVHPVHEVLACDVETGAIILQGRARHPDGTKVHPDVWWDAFKQATSGGVLDGVETVSVGGQQHGMVVFDDAAAVVRQALLWNDTRSADAARDLIDELGGPSARAQAVGAVSVASLTVKRLCWLTMNEPELAQCAANRSWRRSVALVSSPRSRLREELTGGFGAENACSRECGPVCQDRLLRAVVAPSGDVAGRPDRSSAESVRDFRSDRDQYVVEGVDLHANGWGTP